MRVVFGKPLYFNKDENVEEGTKAIEDALNTIDQIAIKHD